MTPSAGSSGALRCLHHQPSLALPSSPSLASRGVTTTDHRPATSTDTPATAPDRARAYPYWPPVLIFAFSKTFPRKNFYLPANTQNHTVPNVNLTETISSNANSSVIDWHGGDGTLAAQGTFSSGTIKLQASFDGGSSFFDAKDADGANLTLNTDGAFSFSIGSCKLRANTAGATVAAGTAQVETITCSGPAATAASATLTVFGLPVAGDTIFFTSPAGVRSTFTFVTGVAGANQISIDALTTPALVASAIAALSVSGITESASGEVVTITASAAGAGGNDWAVETVGAYAQRIAVLAGGRDAGTLAAEGVIDVTITSALISPSPFTLNVPVGTGDTLNVWADKVRQRLIDSARLAPHYAVGGTGATITLTKRAPFLANDTTLNVALANGTPSPGITAAPTSANTTAGVATTPAIRVSIQRRY